MFSLHDLPGGFAATTGRLTKLSAALERRFAFVDVGRVTVAKSRVYQTDVLSSDRRHDEEMDKKTKDKVVEKKSATGE